MRTFFIITRGPKGPRGGRGMTNKFVILANDEFEAKQRALAHVYVDAGATVVDCTEVTAEASILCVG